MIAEAARGVKDGGVTSVVEVGNGGGGQIPLLPVGEFAEAVFVGGDEEIMLAAVEWAEGGVLEVRDVGRGEEFTDEGNAGGSGELAAKKDGGLLAPRGFAMDFEGLAEDAGEGEGAEGVAAAVVARDERGVKAVHEDVVAEGRCVVEAGGGGGERSGGPGDGEGLRAVDVVGFDHVAAFIEIETVGGVGGHARRIEDSRGGESVASAPTNHAAAEHEVEVPGRETGVGLLDAELREGAGVAVGDADERCGEAPAGFVAQSECGLDEELVMHVGKRGLEIWSRALRRR